jgi:hypothetical protein
VNAARCITCDRPVEWAQTLRARKWIPLDPGPVEDGNLEVMQRRIDGTAVVRLVPVADRPGRTDLRRTHFATCPHAAEHRR